MEATLPKPIKKLYNNGQWTEARFHSFIKSALRAASSRWGPKWQVKKKARKARGIYECAGYGRKSHNVPASLPAPVGKKRRVDNAVVDHIHPVIDPDIGFTSWDSLVDRMFCEADGLQILCHECHSAKTKDERSRNVARRQRG
jgi:hypothetical protein